MCGIAGWVDVGLAPEAAEPTLARMCEAIRHRGPDERGFFLGEGVALGTQRLSIVDIAGGHQPMAGEESGVHVAFNGEIYNHAALRAALAARGAPFRTRSDTEVILRTYEADGIDGFTAFNGMFAIAVWDGRRRRLALVRDRLGVKPLYYAPVGRGLLFASEIKAILASGLVRKAVNPRAIWDYLTLRYVPGPQTVWQGVYKLQPGHRLLFERGGGAPRPQRWWDVPLETPAPARTDAEYLDEFATLFEDAVGLRLLADVPVGILLSGGLDSSAVAAAAARNGAAVETFSVAFDGAPGIDERTHARAVARHLGARHHEVVIDRRAFTDFLPELVHLTDEPLADLASVPLHFVSRLARASVKVVLSGEGSDEILGGYTFDRWVALWERARARAHRPAPVLRRAVGGALARLAPAAAAWTAAGVETDLRRLPVPLVMTDLASSAEKRRWLRAAGDFPDSLDRAREQLARIGEQDPLNQALYVYCQDWLVEDLLMKADRMSMGNALELRVPFLDVRLVEWAWRLPPRLKVGREDGRGPFTKLILRRYARGRLPATVIERPKMGFPVPAYDWLSRDLAGWAGDLLGPTARVREWLRDGAVESLRAAGTGDGASQPARHRLWNLLVLELWMRRWLG